MTPDFWPDSGYTLLQRNAQGRLVPTADYLRAWLGRPELALVAESCAAEIELHEALREEPLRTVSAPTLAALADDDARQNYAHYLALRDGLLSAGTLEAWLVAQWRSGAVRVPPLFIDLVVQAVLRGLLDDSQNAFEARAAEMLFRPQRLSTHEGRLLAGDRETLDLQHDSQGLGDIGRLLVQAKIPVKALNIEVLQADAQSRYWAAAARPRALNGHHGGHPFLLDLTHELTQQLGHGLEFHVTNAHSGLKALAAVLERWVAHMLGLQVNIRPLQKIDDPQWRWHVGLDVESSALLNDLYEDKSVSDERLARLVSLFRLDFVDPGDMRADVAGKPVYLGLMMTPDKLLRVKPQNLLLNLPLATVT